MQAVLAIARQTLKAAFRNRLVPVLILLLLGGVLTLPAIIKDDGTARGLSQIVLAYTLGLTTAILGLTTLWLACSSIAREIEECQLQMVVVKPVGRWQIWVGKWIGILALDVLVLAIAAGIIFAQIQLRARGLPEPQQEVLRNEVFVARDAFKPPMPDIEGPVEEVLKERLKNPNVAAMDRGEARKVIREQVLAQLQIVPPGFYREWTIDMSGVRDKVRGQPLFLRTKFFSAERAPGVTFMGAWDVGPETSPKRWRDVKSQAPETFHEFAIPPDLLDEKGILTVRFVNQNELALLFPLDEGMEVLYREGSFGLNYFRGVAIIFCWLALLAAMGLMASTFLSFPVAAFLSFAVLMVGFSSGTINQVIEEGTIRPVDHDTGKVANPNIFDHATVFVFKGVKTVIGLARDFSPIDSLSAGRTITWATLARAAAQIILLLGGLFALMGIRILNGRELATAQAKT